MVGILKKIQSILKTVQNFAPMLNNVVPGLGSIVSAAAGVGSGIARGADNVYDDYQRSKKAGTKFKFTDGVKSFLGKGENSGASGSFGSLIGDVVGGIKDVAGGVKSISNTSFDDIKNNAKKVFSGISTGVVRPPAAMKSLTKSYGDLHPRLRLKGEDD
jgi:type IV secretory pathway TrbL component